MNNYRVRQIKQDELSVVYELYKLGFDDKCPNLPFKYGIINTETCYVLLLNNSIIGMVVTIPCYFNEEKGHQIHALTIKNEFRGEKLGLLLLGEVLNYRKFIGDKFSILVPSNERLYNYYSKLGYKDIVTMGKVLAPNDKIVYTGGLVKYNDDFKTYCLQSAKLNNCYTQIDPCMICAEKEANLDTLSIIDCYPDMSGNIVNSLNYKIKIYLPDNHGNRRFGMAKSFDNKKRYGILPWLTNK